MTQKFYLLSKSLLTKIALVAALMSWGNLSLYADAYTEILTFEGSIPSGWTSENHNTSFPNNELTPSGTWSTINLISNNTISLVNTQKIVITAKAQYSTSAAIKYFISSSKTFPTSPTESFNNTNLPDQENYYELPINIAADQNKYIKISCMRAVIKKIEFKAASGETINEITLDETGEDNTNFSSITSATIIPTVNVKYTPVTGWNSICMPFKLKDNVEESIYMSTIFGSGWKAYGLSSYENGVITFSQRSGSNRMFENEPHLVYCVNPQTPPIEGFSFSNVEVIYSASRRSTSQGATFQGTYAPIAAGSMPVGSYGLTPSGQIRPAGSKSSLKGYRAYFTGVSAPSGGSDVRLFILDGDETTDVGLFKMVEGEEHRVFNLNGQEVQKAKKGLYIVNGKKIVIK